GRLATVQVMSLLTLGGVAWVLSGFTAGTGAQTGGDLWLAALAELGNVVVLASFGAASVLLLPIAGSGGRHILRWSPLTWVVLTLTSFAALATLFVPALTRAAETGGLLAPVLLALGFAAVCVSAWAWNRFVAADEPDEA
ncbi:MAG: hypothetical protein Q7T71_07550, partial [Herbiconiux sp.]|nr:hypothetical protein [Herbiconiux sp.]